MKGISTYDVLSIRVRAALRGARNENGGVSPRALLLISAACVLALGGVLGARFARGSGSSTASSSDSSPAIPMSAVKVLVAQPARRDMDRELSIPSSLEAFEQTTLYAKTAGYLKWIKADIGDRVTKGQVLAEIDLPEMAPEYKGAQAEVEHAMANAANAEAELRKAKAELALKKVTYERIKSVRDHEPDVMPQQEVDEARAQYEVAQAVVAVAESKVRVAQSDVSISEAAMDRLATLMRYTRIVAPFSGVVVRRYVDSGAMIQQASSQSNVSPVLTIARIDLLRVFTNVTEPDVPSVKIGNRAKIELDALPGRTIEGAVTRFAMALDPKTRTMKTEIDIQNKSDQLRPGMYGKVRLTLERHENALTVPAQALAVEGGKTYLYVVNEGKANRTEVKTGFDDGSDIEITSGLSGNEQIIESDRTGIKDGTPVSPTLTKRGLN